MRSLTIISSKISYSIRLLCVVFIMLSVEAFSQMALDTISTMDMALVARNNTNKGNVIIQGEIDNSGGTFDFDQIKIKVYKGTTFYATDSLNHVEQVSLEQLQSLTYDNDIANFGFTISIEAELFNYSFKIIGVKNSVETILKSIKDVVAGDVYVIQGQSNALAESNNSEELINGLYQNDFIRVFSTPNNKDTAITNPSNNQWFIGDGDNRYYSNACTGQWGLKLAWLIVQNQGIPVAIFNGAKGNRAISYFLKTETSDSGQTTNNYERLYYRLNKTGLVDNVKAILWSQGESDSSTSLQNYKDRLNSLINDWNTDYSFGEVYIFQTKSSCGGSNLMDVKEAQRQIAVENNLHIMQTTGLDYNSNCHFSFTNGYDEFANRIYKLIDRDFYGSSTIIDIESPSILNAYLTDVDVLTIETDASELFNNSIPTSVFAIVDSNDNDITIDNIVVDENKVNFELSSNLDAGSTVSYLGLLTAENSNQLITNTEGIELICFDEYEIDASLETVWNGSSWSNGLPNMNIDAVIAANFSDTSNNLVTDNLTINSGREINFNNQSTNSVVIYGNLIVDGDLIVGDTESLLIKNTNADVTINGSFTKKEKTTMLTNMYDVTYWSSPVEALNIGLAFPDVDENRIFYMDPSTENPNYTGQYYQYRHWFTALTNSEMTLGKGYAVDGNLNDIYPNQMEVAFVGKPNYKDISIAINTHTTISNTDPDSDKTNFLGNPYPVAIDADLLIQENIAVFEGTIYLWSHETEFVGGTYNASDYITYNYLGSNDSDISSPFYIASSQGFMILTNESAATFNFKNTMQVENKNDHFIKSEKSKKQETKKIWLKLTDDKKNSKEILIGFDNKATNGFDKGLDGKLFNEENIFSFYSIINNEKYVIQGVNSEVENKAIQLGIDNLKNSNYTLEVSKLKNITADVKIILEDKLLGVFHDLTQSNYQFEITEKGSLVSRFVLMFSQKTLSVEENKKDWIYNISNTKSGIKVQSNFIVTEVCVYDLLGRKLKKDNPNTNNFSLILNAVKSGTILIVTSTFENGMIQTKKIIKY